MPITRRWSDYRNGDIRAAIGYDAVGYSDGEQAKNACPIQFNSEFPENSDFKCDGLDVSTTGPASWRIVAGFSIPEGGEEHPPESGDPTTSPPRIRWDIGNTTEPVDRDANGSPILNSAGDAFDPPLQKNFGLLFLSITRWEPTPFDVRKAIRYQNKLNRGQVTFQGLNIKPHEMLCRSITPNEYTTKDKRVEVTYNFELREDLFKARVMDLGLAGWVDSSIFGGRAKKTELFAGMGTNTTRTANIGQQISFPIRLDGTGKPMDSSIKGLAANTFYDPAANPTVPTNFTVESTAFATFLKFQMYADEDFGGMGL